jgi:hypothetical protein
MQCYILGVFLKTVSFPPLGSDQAHSARSSETRVHQVLGFILAKEEVGSLHLFVANACYPKPNKMIREKPLTNGFPMDQPQPSLCQLTLGDPCLLDIWKKGLTTK